jgi:hypothetical protein
MQLYKISDLRVNSFGFYMIWKKNFKIFKKSNFGALLKALESYYPPNCIHFARYITQGLSNNTVRFIHISKKKNFFSLLTIDLNY